MNWSAEKIELFMYIRPAYPEELGSGGPCIRASCNFCDDIWFDGSAVDMVNSGWFSKALIHITTQHTALVVDEE